MTTTLLIEQELDTRWGDMDALGHINHATYLSYCETVRVAWFEQLSGRIGESAGAGPVLAQVRCDYRLPVVHPARLRVSMHGHVPGRSSVRTDYEIRDAEQPERLYATSTAIVVWVDYQDGKSRPLPPSIRDVLPATD